MEVCFDSLAGVGSLKLITGVDTVKSDILKRLLSLGGFDDVEECSFNDLLFIEEGFEYG